MLVAADRPEAPTAIRTDLGAIFVSMELSKSTWLITSLSPGGGEKMSKYAVAGGDIAGLFARFAQLREKAQARTGKYFPIDMTPSFPPAGDVTPWFPPAGIRAQPLCCA